MDRDTQCAPSPLKRPLGRSKHYLRLNADPPVTATLAPSRRSDGPHTAMPRLAEPTTTACVPHNRQLLALVVVTAQLEERRGHSDGRAANHITSRRCPCQTACDRIVPS